MRLARKGQEIQAPEDVFKDPVVLEFVGLPESHRLVESELEDALLTNLQAFLLELGKGFAFLRGSGGSRSTATISTSTWSSTTSSSSATCSWTSRSRS